MNNAQGGKKKETSVYPQVWKFIHKTLHFSPNNPPLKSTNIGFLYVSNKPGIPPFFEVSRFLSNILSDNLASI